MNKNIKIITKYWDVADLKKIKNYESFGGYKALHKFIKDKNSDKFADEIKNSSLLGRGGAGFPTGDKLEAVAGSGEKERYFICNLDESEPGTYKDRAIVDNDPHKLIEGIIILSLIIGARKAFIYINGNYGKQEEILENALEEAYKKKYWGEKILKSDYNLEIGIFSGAGAYICGEETALINSIEGSRGEPKMRPPYPTEKGLFGKPTLVNNAETISNISWIVIYGGEEYAKIGSKNSPGTKLFVLGGAVKKPGVYELPLGVTIRELIFEIGGGLAKGKEFWFAQIGGSSGRLIMEKELDAKLEFGNKDFSIGSGAILVVDKTTNIYDLLLSWTGFFRRESCGKCVPCREGTFRLWEIAKRLQDGEISEADKKAVKDILWTLENTTFCPFGKFAAAAFRDAVEKLKILK
ncbi:MAG TPA: NADH-ubiquinone oxidoreductase-F iron-sulfur binding region domain-containing protein [Candidatus Moranbacteria bacterium]|nr:NADH-ubiquinone oxidoreductase-F iron-sulfur binding region domain-containing protein [Candidatus Moranbacteria bacterium]